MLLFPLHILEQILGIHSCDSWLWPKQWSPNRLGGGFEQSLLRLFIPMPHVTEHDPHSCHWLQPPCTELGLFN
jgi:hypothetical protein